MSLWWEGEREGPPGKAQSCASQGSQGPRGHGAQDKGQLQGSQQNAPPPPNSGFPLARRQVALFIWELTASPPSRQQEGPAVWAQASAESIVAWVPPGRLPSASHSFRLCPWGSSRLPRCLAPHSPVRILPLIRMRPLLLSLLEELLVDELTYFGTLHFLIPRIWR